MLKIFHKHVNIFYIQVALLLAALGVEIEKHLGKTGINNMHIHISGIAYGEKGEKNHLLLKESKFNYKDLIKTLKEFKCKAVVTCESPNIEKDALLLQETYQKA